MAGENHYINYSAQDIEKYLKGHLSAKEMHAMEKAAHEDPFLAEALEGFVNADDREVTAALAQLNTNLANKTEAAPVISIRRANKWLSAAAVLLLIIGGATTWYVLTPTETSHIAQQKKKLEESNKDSVSKLNEITANDSVTMAPEISVEQADTVILPNKQLNDEPSEKAAQSKVNAKKPAPVLKTQQSDDEINTKNLQAVAAEQAESLTNARNSEISGELPGKRAVSIPIESEKRAFPYNPQTIKTYVFTGSITDSNKQMLPFVNVSIPNTNINTYSDARGRFRVVAGDSTIRLHLKALGYLDREVDLAQADGNVSIKMQQVNVSLDDVVVVGYGKGRKQKVDANNKKNHENDEAEPIDGWTNYDTYLQNNVRLQNPSSIQQQGTVELSFMVDAYGNPFDFEVNLSSCAACEKEAVRLIKQGPRWKILGEAKTAKVSLTMYF